MRVLGVMCCVVVLMLMLEGSYTGMIDVSDVLLMLEGSWSGMIDVSDR
jgi:hypothetical protein